MTTLDKLKSQRDEGDRRRVDLRFWTAEDPFQAVFANATRLSRYNNARREQAFYYASLYDDSELAAMIQGSGAADQGVPQSMTINITRRQVDTYTNKIVKNRALPMALTSGGPFGAKRRAQAINKFAEGTLEKVGYWPTRELRVRDSAIFGSGIARNYRIGRKLHHDRTLPGEVMWDPRDAYYGKPRTIYIKHHVDRLVLIEQHPDFEDQINSASSRLAEDDLWGTWDDEMSDVVVVIEAIHLPSSDLDYDDLKKEKKTDGAYAKCISNATLHEGAYLRDYHPLSKTDFQRPLVGWYGEGMVRQLAGLQYEVNSVGLRLQEGGFMTGSYVWSQDQGGLEVDTLDNATLSVIRSATEPKFFAPAPWHPAFMEYHEGLMTRRPQDITGLPGFATRGELPPGLEGGSGIAIQHARDEGAENLILQGRGDERDVIDTTWQLFDLMEEIHEEEGEKGTKYSVRVRESAHGRDTFTDQDYEKVRTDRKECTLVVFPTSYLASTPADRWAQVAEMSDKGYFSTDEGMSLLGFPDIKRILNLRNAPRDVVEAIVEKLLDPDFKNEEDGSDTITPESAMNLDLCVAIGALAYLEAKWIDHAPEAITARVLAFSVAARKLRDEPPAGMPAGPQPGSQDPNALPGDAPIVGDVNMPGQPAPIGPPGPPQLMAPPAGPLLPDNAVAPTALPPVGA